MDNELEVINRKTLAVLFWLLLFRPLLKQEEFPMTFPLSERKQLLRCEQVVMTVINALGEGEQV
jgi:hypothetical protein